MYAGNEPDIGSCLIRFPVEYGRIVHTQGSGNVLLMEVEIEPLGADMISQGIETLWIR